MLYNALTRYLHVKTGCGGVYGMCMSWTIMIYAPMEQIRKGLIVWSARGKDGELEVEVWYVV